MPLVLRSTKGSDLTPAEADGNFTYLDGIITALQSDVAAINGGIDYIEQVGNDLYVHYVNHTVDGPFTLPTADWNPRGEWAATTLYAAYDVVSNSGSVYLVLAGHTSAATFDPAANNGMGQDYYKEILRIPNLGVKEVTDANYTPVAGDANAYLRCTNAGGCAFSVPDDATLNFPIGTQFHVRDECISGAVTFDALSPAAINGVAGFLNISAGNGATITLIKVAADSWDIMGLLAAGSP